MSDQARSGEQSGTHAAAATPDATARRWPGLFVAFEGVDGAGKSAQLRLAATRLAACGREVVATREPGGSPGAEEIRALLVTGAPERWSAETELLLFTAARRDHWETIISPALGRGAVVLCDRFIDSTRAYQSAGRGAVRADVEALHALMIGAEPDLALVFDVSPETAAARGGAEKARLREDRYERFGAGFAERLRAAYRALVAEAPARRRLIDAEPDVETVARAALAEIDAALLRAGL